MRVRWPHAGSWLSKTFGSRQRWLTSTGLAAALCVIYFALARLSLFLLTEPEGLAVFWPAAGFSSGTLITLGRSARWPVAVGVVAAALLVHLTTDGLTLVSFMFALCYAGETMFIAWVVERFVGRQFSLGKLRHMLWLLVAATTGAGVSGIGSAVAVSLFQNPGAPVVVAWWHWFATNLVGIVTSAPLIIGIASLVRVPPPRHQVIEAAAALVAVLAVMATIIFVLPEAWWDRIAPVELLLPLLIWIAARCRPAFTAFAVFIISLTIVGAFIFRLGHFGDVGPSMEQSVLATHAAVMGVAIFSFILTSLFSERRLAEKNQRTLTSELQHRTNNLLTVVQIIANRTLSGQDPLREKQVLEARLRALARANKQLTELDWSGLTLGEIIRSELESYLPRVEIDGTDIVLDHQYAQNFSLVLHELATNAIKYGAMSNLEGRVVISWRTKGVGRDRQLMFQWREHEGPPVVAPTRQGFGSRLLSATFPSARCYFDPDGFRCEIEVPLRQAAARAPSLQPASSPAVGLRRPAPASFPGPASGPDLAP